MYQVLESFGFGMGCMKGAGRIEEYYVGGKKYADYRCGRKNYQWGYC